jgi:hypothetical protein
MTTFPLRIRAVFRDGKFVPTDPCSLPESAEVQLTVESSREPSSVEKTTGAATMHAVVQAMMANPIPPGAPRFTRDELHERR